MFFPGLFNLFISTLLLTSPTITGQRAAPPSPLTCDRNHLTSFTGRVVSYHRDKSRIALNVHTDEETDEKFSIPIETGDDGSKRFLMRGKTFTKSDWNVIEVSQSKLRPGMRAIVWVCDDGSAPVVDWRPREP